MKIDTSIKAIPAPIWFQEGWKALKVFEKELAQVLGISHSFVEKRRIKMLEKPNVGRKEVLEAAMDTIKHKKKEFYTEKEQEKIDIITALLKTSMKALWLRFQLENLEEVFEGKDLQYDFTNQTIIIGETIEK